METIAIEKRIFSTQSAKAFFRTLHTHNPSKYPLLPRDATDADYEAFILNGDSPTFVRWKLSSSPPNINVYHKGIETGPNAYCFLLGQITRDQVRNLHRFIINTPNNLVAVGLLEHKNDPAHSADLPIIISTPALERLFGCSAQEYYAAYSSLDYSVRLRLTFDQRIRDLISLVKHLKSVPLAYIVPEGNTYINSYGPATGLLHDFGFIQYGATPAQYVRAGTTTTVKLSD